MGDIVKIFKGSVPSSADLPLSGNVQGDVYTVIETGAQYYWEPIVAVGDLMDWRLINDPEQTAGDGTGSGLLLNNLEVVSNITVGGDIDVDGTGSTIRVNGVEVATVQDVADAVSGGTGAISLDEKSELEMELQYDFNNPSRYKEFVYSGGNLIQINVYTDSSTGATQLFVMDLTYDMDDNLIQSVLTRLSDSTTVTKDLSYDVNGVLVSIEVMIA